MSEALQNLKQQLDPLRRRYDSLSDAERWVVNGLGLLILAVIVLLLIVMPAQRAVTQAEMQLNGKQSLLQWMQDNEHLAKQANSSKRNSRTSNQPLQTIVTSTAPSMGVTVKRFEPESDEKLRIWLEKVPFDKTVRWLHQLESRYGIQIANASVDAERVEGLVTAKLVLQK